MYDSAKIWLDPMHLFLAEVHLSHAYNKYILHHTHLLSPIYSHTAVYDFCISVKMPLNGLQNNYASLPNAYLPMLVCQCLSGTNMCAYMCMCMWMSVYCCTCDQGQLLHSVANVCASKIQPKISGGARFQIADGNSVGHYGIEMALGGILVSVFWWGTVRSAMQWGEINIARAVSFRTPLKPPSPKSHLTRSSLT